MRKEKSSIHFGSNGDYRDSWRVFRIMAEFVEGYQFLGTHENEVTVFGSARFKEGDRWYDDARNLGALLGKGHYTTLTGGGPGIMEAANRGAFENKGVSLGLNISLPMEQTLNPYVTDSLNFHYFFTRKVMLGAPAQAYVFYPGGFGTLDEFFEIIDLMADEFLHDAPLILVGKDYWKPVIEWMLKNAGHTVAEHERRLLARTHIVDSAEQAFELIEKTQDVPPLCKLSPENFSCGDRVNWRIFKIMAELVEGFDFLTGISKDVTVLGTRELKEDSKYNKKAQEFGAHAGQRGFAIITGGYQGIAEAACKGAQEHGAQTFGFPMEGGNGVASERYLTRMQSFEFPFVRKFMITAPSKGFVMFPGGLGTLHQTMEVLTLIQTGKMPKVPVVLIGRAFWDQYYTFMVDILAEKYKIIHKEDMSHFTVTDDPQEAAEVIDHFYKENHKHK